MSNLFPILGSGARPAPVVSTEPIPAADASESPSTAPTPDTTAPSADDSSANVTAGPATTGEPFDVSEFHDAFAALKQQVTERRTALTLDVSGLQSEDTQLEAAIADWDARANAAEARRLEIKGELNTKLGEFAQLDEATGHLEATEALLYPSTPAPEAATPAADAPATPEPTA